MDQVDSVINQNKVSSRFEYPRLARLTNHGHMNPSDTWPFGGKSSRSRSRFPADDDH